MFLINYLVCDKRFMASRCFKMFQDVSSSSLFSSLVGIIRWLLSGWVQASNQVMAGHIYTTCFWNQARIYKLFSGRGPGLLGRNCPCCWLQVGVPLKGSSLIHCSYDTSWIFMILPIHFHEHATKICFFFVGQYMCHAPLRSAAGRSLWLHAQHVHTPGDATGAGGNGRGHLNQLWRDVKSWYPQKFGIFRGSLTQKNPRCAWSLLLTLAKFAMFAISSQVSHDTIVNFQHRPAAPFRCSATYFQGKGGPGGASALI